jgi:hypothetical protein
MQQRWKQGLAILKTDLQGPLPVSYRHFNTARALGMAGIEAGALAEQISHIGNLTMALAKM